MSHYADYLRERLGKHVLETEHGFAVFFEIPEERAIYIEDIFVEKDHRETGVASQMADAIAEAAKEDGFQFLLGSVNPKTHGATRSLRVLLGYGMQLSHVKDGLIWFKKEL